jgi:protease-4
MGQFFKFTLASVLGVMLAVILSFFIMIGWMTALVAQGDQEVIVNDHSVLRLKLNHEINDRKSNDPFSNFDFNTMEPKDNLGLTEIIKTIEKAAIDPSIDGIYLNAPTVMGGAAQTEEIRNALLKFKESGKFITAYAEGYDQKGYYLATVADEIYVHPEGMILFKGIVAELMFFKGTLEKLDVDMQVIRHGKFKSAVEPFMLDKMSDANREQTSALIHSIWDNLLFAISESRGISIANLNQAADKLSLDDPLKAVELKFVDGVKYSDEISDILKEKSSKGDDDDLEFISVKNYTKGAFYNESKVAKDKIAVIYANGEIKGGKGDDTYIGEQNIRKALIKSREDDRIKAIVLRVNSPGGSALVSDLIWREVVLAKEEKPVVVSMGNVAASGGYYISCAADYIFADPTTITGSIGVFGLIPNTGKFMTNQLGITFDEASTNENSNYITTNKALSPYQRGVIQNSVERVYDHFITKVANGRNMAKDDVDRIGQGRVWTGSQAIEIGLVDELGGLNSAIAKAAELSEIDNYKIKSLPYQKDPFQQIMEDMMGNSTSIAMKYYLGENYKYVQMFENMENRAIIQTRMPFDMIIE